MPATAADITPAQNTTVAATDLHPETLVPKPHEKALEDITKKGAQTVAKIVTTTVKSAVDTLAGNNVVEDVAGGVAKDVIPGNPVTNTG